MDNLLRVSPEDPHKINMSQRWEVRDWSAKLGVTPDVLQKLVETVGPGVAEVRFAVAMLR